MKCFLLKLVAMFALGAILCSLPSTGESKLGESASELCRLGQQCQVGEINVGPIAMAIQWVSYVLVLLGL